MSDERTVMVVAVAFARGGVLSMTAALTLAERERLRAILGNLRCTGHVAQFDLASLELIPGIEGMIDRIKQNATALAVVAADTPCTTPMPEPAFLVPVFAFDDSVADRPSSTARFGALDLEVIAVPASDEEQGVRLPGRDGAWLIYARPLAT